MSLQIAAAASKGFSYDFNPFQAMFHFYTPWKRQKKLWFLSFLGGSKMGHWPRIG